MTTATDTVIPADIDSLDGIVLVVGSKPACVQCNATKRHLDKKPALPRAVIDMSTDEPIGVKAAGTDLSPDMPAMDLLDKLRELGHMMAPVTVVYKDGVIIDHYSGYRPDKIEAYAALVEAGEELAAA